MRQLTIVHGNDSSLGARLGINHTSLADWVQPQVTDHVPVIEAISDPRLPTQVAMLIARVCILPKVNYLTRALPPIATKHAMADFDSRLERAIISRLQLPNPLPDKANFILHQPIRNSGLGFRSMASIVEAAYWSSSVQSAPIVEPIITNSTRNRDTIQCVQERTACFNVLQSLGAAVTPRPDVPPTDVDWQPLPHSPDLLASHYQGLDTSGLHLQRILTRSIEDVAFACFITSNRCTRLDRARIKACKAKGAGLWKTTVPTTQYLHLDDLAVATAFRANLGLPPLSRFIANRCVCGSLVHTSCSGHH